MRRFSNIRRASLALVATVAVTGFATAQGAAPIKPSPAEAGADPSMAKPEGSATPALKTPALNAPHVRNPESTVGLAPSQQPINNANPSVAGQVVPSSRETAAHNESIFRHDQQPVVTHTFNFTAEQKQAVVAAIGQGKDKAVTIPPFEVKEASILPATVKLNPMPESIAAEMPWVKPYRYVKFGEKIALVDANLRYVAAIIE